MSEWIKNEGCVPDLLENTEVQVELRDGSAIVSEVRFFRWSFHKDNPNDDIVSYRIVEPSA